MEDYEWESIARQLPYLQVKKEVLGRAHEDASLYPLLKGCFVRVLVEVTSPGEGEKKGKTLKKKVGRVARIDGVSDARDGEEMYRLPSGARSSLKFRVWYDGKSKLLTINEISDGPFAAGEIESYRTSTEKNQDEVISLEDIGEKRQAFRDFLAEKRRNPFPDGFAAKRPATAQPPLPGMPPPLPAGAPPPLPPGPPVSL
eukprot:TRINITY_DN20260_c0_g1_i1.p1 TRINITY_DN20260_c0_g1~~TRINITY_DN20260_c0_g1_i1.p1  ORF type:complete len:200 (+),score=87.04 TRINITY_DN20260_c0_g1_i1:48-647(+)